MCRKTTKIGKVEGFFSYVHIETIYNSLTAFAAIGCPLSDRYWLSICKQTPIGKADVQFNAVYIKTANNHMKKPRFCLKKVKFET